MSCVHPPIPRMLLRLPCDLIEHILGFDTLARRICLQSVCKALVYASDDLPSRTLTFDLKKRKRGELIHTTVLITWNCRKGWDFGVRHSDAMPTVMHLPADFYKRRRINDDITVCHGQLIVPWSRWSIPFSQTFRNELEALDAPFSLVRP